MTRHDVNPEDLFDEFDECDESDECDVCGEFDDPYVWGFLKRRLRQNKSISNDKTVFRQYPPLLGEKSVIDAEFTDAVEYADFLVSKGCTRTTIQVYFSSINKLNQFLNQFYGANMPDVSSIPEMYNDLKECHERKPIDRDEVRRLIDATTSLRDALIIGFLYYTGTRVSIPVWLKLRAVDMAQSTIDIGNLKNSGERTISIHEDLEFLLRVWLTEERSAYPPAHKSPYVFVGERSAERLDKGDVWEIVHEAAHRAGIQEAVGETAHGNTIWRVKPHVLRHSFATHGFEDGMTKSELATFLGQKNDESIEIYIESDDVKEAMEAYNATYKGLR